MSTERERLAKMLRNAYDRIGPDAVPTVDRIASDLLAAGVTLPPEPPALVTEEMVRRHATNSTTTWPSAPLGRPETTYRYDLLGATALVSDVIRKHGLYSEAQIRGALLTDYGAAPMAVDTVLHMLRRRVPS